MKILAFIKVLLKKIFSLPLFFGILFLGNLGFLSCGSFSGGKSWSSPETADPARSIRLFNVSVQKSGDWLSVENELTGLAPLIFAEQGYTLFPNAEGEKDGPLWTFAADLRVFEREYTQGWETKRSVSVEIRLWRDQGGNAEAYQSPPLAAGQFISLGDQTLSSSKHMGAMLTEAVKQALNALKARLIREDREARKAQKEAAR
jgi:hypothetical protein